MAKDSNNSFAKNRAWIAPNEELALDMVRFEWAQVIAFDDAERPKITTDDLLDTPPGRLRLGLQPYLSLLELNYAVDRFLLAVKKREADTLRSEASNTFESMPHLRTRKRAVRRPRRERVFLVVHRYDNMLYYKRLEPEAFAILRGLQAGEVRGKSLCRGALEIPADECRLGLANSGMVSRLVSLGLVLSG